MPTSFPTVAILGAGHMGGAILGGLQQRGVQVDALRVTTRSEASAVVHRRGVVEVRSLEEDALANQWAVTDAEIIVLGVKPYQILELLTEIAPFARPDAVVVSVAAGVTLEQMEAVWPGAVIRTMPNTPVQVGRGVTGMAMGSRVTTEHHSVVRSLFETVGSVVEVPESNIDALSAFSGSGPAYVFFLIEAFVQLAIERGFSSDVAKVMVEETFHGALALLDQTGSEPQDLREAVTSPGGSTAAALAVFADADLPAVISRAVDAAAARAQELAGD